MEEKKKTLQENATSCNIVLTLWLPFEEIKLKEAQFFFLLLYGLIPLPICQQIYVLTRVMVELPI